MTFSRSVEKWNNLLDWTTGCLVKGATSCLPRAAKEIIHINYFTQAKSLTHGLLVVACLNGTIGNSSMSRWAAYVISGVVIGPTLGLAWRYQKVHFMDIAALPRARAITACAIPIICGVAEPAVLYNIGMYTDTNFYLSFPVNLWSAYGTVCLNMISHIALLEKERASSEESEGSVDTDSIESKVATQTLQLEEEIAHLKDKIKKLENFILNNSELKKVAFEALQNYQQVYAKYTPPSKNNLDPNDPIDRMTLLGLERNALLRDLEERMLFIQRNPPVYECFKKHMTSPPTPPTNESLFLLTLD